MTRPKPAAIVPLARTFAKREGQKATARQHIMARKSLEAKQKRKKS